MVDIVNKPNKMNKQTYYLNGLTCAHCAGKIEEELKNDQKLEEVSFSFATKKLIFYSDFFDEEAQLHIQKKVDEIEDGIRVSKLEGLNTGDSKENKFSLKDENNGQEKWIKSEKILAFVNKYSKEFLGSVLLFALIVNASQSAIAIVGFLLAYLLIGGDIAMRAVKNLLKGQLFDEHFLMTLATLGAFAIGEYTEAVAVMLFYKVGEGFQDYAVDNTRRSIKALLDIKAEYANRMTEGSSEKVEPSELKVDDYILIRAGEKVPVDCILIDGVSSINTAALTGESKPQKVKPGQSLLSGSINLDASLKAKVINTYENSTVAKILDMVENATGKKARTEQFITKFAKIYTPIVVVSASILAFIPPLLGFGDFRDWISRALIFLVISCPCALVLSVPLGFFGGLGAASRKGILVKGGNYLEALNGIDTFVFDKTGTLTKGNFALVSYTNEETLRLAAILELHSTHPIAKSILDYSPYTGTLDMANDVREIPGEGLVGVFENKPLYVGNHRLMERYHIDIEDSEFVGSLVYVAYNQAYIGKIEISDEIKESAYELVRRLKEANAKSIIMLTGDQREVAEYVAKELAIETVYSELLPQDKLMHVEALIQNKQKVLFVGDGINDAPVLARAHIGVAMGGVGSDAAIEAADMILMNDEPMKLMDAKKIAKGTRRIVIQNIVFALGVKLFFLILGAFGFATMYEAIFADVGVALIAVVNSMRTLRIA
jgi:Cd2+/Zn2+-exporting ATPase